MSMLLAERRRAREFADLLGGGRAAAGTADGELATLAALAASLRPAPLVPRAEFRRELRGTLVAEAARLRPTPVEDGPRQQQSPFRPPQRRHRLRGLIAAGVAASLLGGVGVAAASTRALPGDPLYGVKRGLESVQLRLAHSDLSRGRELLEQADHRLSEAEALASSADGHSADGRALISQALTDMAAATDAGAAELRDAYASSGDRDALDELGEFAADQQQRLDDLAAILDPALRERVARLSDRVSVLRSQVEALLPASAAPGAAPGAGPADTALALATAHEQWAAGRLSRPQPGSAGPGRAGHDRADGAGGTGQTGVLDGVGALVSGLLGSSPSASSGGGSGDNGGLPLPLPSLPPLGGSGSPSAAPTLPLPLPSVSLPGLPCVLVPPLTSC